MRLGAQPEEPVDTTLELAPLPVLLTLEGSSAKVVSHEFLRLAPQHRHR